MERLLFAIMSTAKVFTIGQSYKNRKYLEVDAEQLVGHVQNGDFLRDAHVTAAIFLNFN